MGVHTMLPVRFLQCQKEAESMCYPTTERPCQKTNIGLLDAIQFLKTSPKSQCEKQSFTSALDKVLLEKYHTNPRKTPIGRSHFSKIQSGTFSTLLKIEYTRYFFPRTLPDTQASHYPDLLQVKGLYSAYIQQKGWIQRSPPYSLRC